MLTVLKALAARVPWGAELRPDDAALCKTFDQSRLETWVRAAKAEGGIVVADAREKGKEWRTASLEELSEVPEPRRDVSVPTRWIDTAWVVEDKELRANEFFNEFAIAWLVAQRLSDLPQFSACALLGGAWHAPRVDLPVVARTRRDIYTDHDAPAPPKTSRRASDHNKLWFRLAGDARMLDDVVDRLSIDQFRSVLQQVFVALRIAQARIALKHHDMHLGNVMITKTADGEETYETPEGPVTIRTHGIRALIIDFGLASATDPDSGLRVRRLDEELMLQSQEDASDASGGSWGVWGSVLEGDEGYDVAMLVESITEELVHERPLNIPKLELLSRLQALVPTDFTRLGRPAERTRIDWAQVWRVF